MEKNMKLKKCVWAACAILCAAGVAAAQEMSGNIAALEFQTPKNGMVKQYEDGRKQKVEWHKQQKDSQPLMVWQTISGDHTGTYIVGRLGERWSDMDKPSVPDQADLDEYNKVVGSYVQSMEARYYEFLPKVSRPPEGNTPSKFSEVLTFRVRPGREDDFHSGIVRVTEAAEKTKWNVNYLWYVLVNGGEAGTHVLVIPHASWSDFEDKPGVKPLKDMLREAFGDAEADSITKRFDASIESQTSEVIQFRPDLSYMPAM
jgi:hypothetical protein